MLNIYMMQNLASTSIPRFVGGFAIFAKRPSGHVVYILFKHNRIIKEQSYFEEKATRTKT